MAQPIKWLPDRFAAGGSASETESFISAPPTGEFEIDYRSETSGDSDILMLAVRASGDAAFVVGASPSPTIDEQQPSHATLSYGGNTARVWTEDNGGAFDIYASVVFLNSGVGGLTPRFLVNAGATTGAQKQPEVVALDFNRFAFTWEDLNTGKLTFAIYDAAGNQVKAPTALSTSNVNQGFHYGLVALDNGDWLAAYRITSGPEAVFRILSSGGSFETAEIDVDGSGNYNGAVGATSLGNGRFVVVYSDVLPGIRGTIFNNDGTPATGEFDILAGSPDYPQVAALLDGRFMVVASRDGDIFGQTMFADGTKDGAEFRVNDVTTGTQSFSSIETLADGRVVVSWTTDEVGNNDIKYAIYDPREAAVTLAGTGIHDDLIGSEFNDVISTGLGNDWLNGAGGNDSLYGGAGDDLVSGGSGADTIDGGIGNDTVTYASSGHYVVLDLSAGVAWDGTVDTLSSIENATGTQFDDILAGDAGNNVLNGGSGNDLLDLSSGGTDTATGGAGNDTVSYETAGHYVVVGIDSQTAWEGTVDTLSSIENAIGTRFGDQFYGDNNNNVFDVGSGGGDAVSGGNGLDTISYAHALHYVVLGLDSQSAWDGEIDNFGSIENAIGSRFDDNIMGSSGANVLDGGPGGSDIINGGGGIDTVSYASNAQRVYISLGSQVAWDGVTDTLTSIEFATGSRFDDVISGDNGGNILDGGAGADSLEGLGGNDVFAFVRGEGNGDSVTDFTGNGAGVGDNFQFSGYGTGGATFTQTDATHWSINSSDGLVHDIITLTNGASVHASDYLFV